MIVVSLEMSDDPNFFPLLRATHRIAFTEAYEKDEK